MSQCCGERDLDIVVGYADNQPTPGWVMPFDTTGSDFELTVTCRGISRIYRASTGDLVVSNGSKNVAWPMSGALASIYPPGSYVTYRLRRVVPGGEIRTYANGRFIISLGNETSAHVTLSNVGPQGPPGERGAPGPQGPSSSGFGYAVYMDGRFTAAHPLKILSGRSTPVSIDGLGSGTDTTQLKGGFADAVLWQNDRFTPLGLNDNYLLRLNFIAQSLVINNAIKVDVNIGGAIGSLYQTIEIFGVDAGQARPFSFAIPVYAKATFIANGAAMTVTPSFDIQLWNASIEIVPLGMGG